MGDIIQEQNPEQGLAATRAAITTAQGRFGQRRVIGGVLPREPQPAGAPSSPSGTRVAFTELDADLQALLIATAAYHDARVATTSLSALTIGTAGQPSLVSDSTESAIIQWTGVLSADITATGVGGLDAGVEAANTWYFVYVIGSTTGAEPPAALLSASSSAPTLPLGYDAFRRVGTVRNNAAANFLGFRHIGMGRTKDAFYNAFINVLAAGPAIGVTPVSLVTAVPPTSVFARLSLFEGGTAAALLFGPTGGIVYLGAASPDAGEVSIPTTTGQLIGYGHFLAAGGSLFIFVMGYREEL